MDDPLTLSKEYLSRVRSDEQTRELTEKLAVLPKSALKRELTTDNEIISFWINLYNAATHDALDATASSFPNRFVFFYVPRIRVAREYVSLNGIEHGILRRGKPSFTFGYGPAFPIRGFYRGVRPSFLDFRIHFLLNCGAKSCPPVRRLDGTNYDKTAEDATQSYLQNECVWREDTLVAPRILRWYRGDFGGTDGIRQMLRRYDVLDTDGEVQLEYASYDWTPDPI